MLQAFGSLKSVLRPNRRCTETLVFFLHYRVTFLVLVFACILISTQHFVGQKIQCLSKPSGEINVELLNSYCWAASTYSVSSSYLKQVGVHVPHAGVEGSEKQSEYEYRNFYQYVHIVLFIQAVFFYIPHVIWKSMEGNHITNLPEEINNFKTDKDSKDKSNRSSLDAVAIFIEDRWGSHKILVFKYLMCELLAAANVLTQSYLLDVFFHGRFLNMGLLLEAYYSSEIFADPVRLFPLVTVCTFRRYGASGYIDEIDALCVLPINAINGKFFLCIWIWFAVLMLLSVCCIFHLLVCITVPIYRVFLLKLGSYLSMGRINNDSHLELITLGDFGDWFVLSSVRKNMDELNFCRLTENILSRINSLETEVKEI